MSLHEIWWFHKRWGEATQKVEAALKDDAFSWNGAASQLEVALLDGTTSLVEASLNFEATDQYSAASHNEDDVIYAADLQDEAFMQHAAVCQDKENAFSRWEINKNIDISYPIFVKLKNA